MAPGDTLTELRFEITRQDLVRYAGAANDYLPQHWDRPTMQDQGFADVVVHGWLGCAHLVRAASQLFLPDRWNLARYAVRYREPLYPGEICCGGTVIAAAAHCCEVSGWIKNAGGNTVTTAEFTFVARAP